jgi:arsenical pump membrane protein
MWFEWDGKFVGQFWLVMGANLQALPDVGHASATIGIFVLTLFLMLKKPWGLHEAWATIIGAALMLSAGTLTWAQAGQKVVEGGDVLAFLLALMFLSALLDQAGFFEWCALTAIKAAKGNGQALFRNVFLVGAAVTAFLSLDTTAIILTPIVVSLVQKIKIEARPFLIACAFIANTASLLLPVSNLTNLLFQHAFNLSFFVFVAHMLVPQIVALVLNYLLFLLIFRKSLPQSFDDDTPEAASALHNPVFFKVSVATIALVTIGYFIGSLAHVPSYVVAFTGCAIMLVAGALLKQISWSKLFKRVSWELFPFIIGLFVVVAAVENLGLAHLAQEGLARMRPDSLLSNLAIGFGSGIGSNIVNNIPMALLAISVLQKAHSAGQSGLYAALIGCNLGPNITIAGSLATMLVISEARKGGEKIDGWQFFKTGALVTPVLLFASCLALWLWAQALSSVFK